MKKITPETIVQHAANFDGTFSMILMSMSKAETLGSFQACQIFLNACLESSQRQLEEELSEEMEAEEDLLHEINDKQYLENEPVCSIHEEPEYLEYEPWLRVS